MMLIVTYTTLDGELLGETRSGIERDYLPDPMGFVAATLDGEQRKAAVFGGPLSAPGIVAQANAGGRPAAEQISGWGASTGTPSDGRAVPASFVGVYFEDPNWQAMESDVPWE
jgi:hypothetical protein